MKITLRFKAPVGSRRKDVPVVLYEGEPLPLERLKDLWQVEQTLNQFHIRVHLEVETENR